MSGLPQSSGLAPPGFAQHSCIKRKLTFSDKRHDSFNFDFDIFEDTWIIQKTTNVFDRRQTVETIVSKKSTAAK